MPDLFEPLRGTPDQLTRPPLTPEDVRRRGDRMRRRRAAGSAVGAALAVALVVGGGLTLADGLGAASAPAPAPPATQPPSDSPAPSPAPEDGWRTSIPAGLPIAEDLRRPTSVEEELAGPGADVEVFDVPFEACGREALLGAGVDRLGVRFGAPEHYDGRQLTVYVDEAAARRVLLAVTGVYEQCPEHVYPGQPDTAAVSTVIPVELGEEGFVVERTFTTDGMRSTGLELLHLVRVGNALLVTSLSNEGGSTDETVADQLRARNDTLAPVADAMCVFAAEGCDGAPSPERADAAGPQEYEALGPDGYGPVHLGMTAEEAEATSWVTLEDSHGDGCTPFTVVDDGTPVARGTLSRKRGLLNLSPLVDLRTPEGIGQGSTRAEVEAAYGELRDVKAGLVWQVAVPRRTGAVYTVVLVDGRVDAMSLVDEQQDCIG